MNVVSAVLSDSVKVAVTDASPANLQALGAQVNGSVAHLPFASTSELAAVLTALQGAGFHFADEPAGWPPAAVFQELRKASMVSGTVRTISWSGPDEPRFGEA